MPTGFAVAGVHMTLAAVLQSCSTVHPVALSTHHLNCTGVALPVAAAVSVIAVPLGCAPARFTVTPLAVTGARIAYGRSAYVSGAFASVPVLRAQTSTMPIGFTGA